MQLIKDIVKTPSAALQAMIDGLLEQSTRSDFVIDMKSFGYTQGGICFGCAATCAVQKIAGRDLTEDGMMEPWVFLGFDKVDFDRFEFGIDSVRGLDFKPLFNYFKLEQPNWLIFAYGDLDYMRSNNWKELIPAFQQIVDRLKVENL